MRILGIHSGHGCGVALIESGRCVYASSEERFARKKILYGFPKQALQDCLSFLKLKPQDIDRIAFSVFNPVGEWSSFAKARIARVRYAGWSSLALFEYPNEEKPFYSTGAKAILFNLLAFTGIPTFLSYFLPSWWAIKNIFGWDKPIDFVGHHESHALGTAYFCGDSSPFSVVSEGYDGEAALKYDVFDSKLHPQRLATTRMPHSPGEFYNCPTFILGYNIHKHCGKITGLAAYGDSNKLIDRVRSLMWEENGEIRISPKVNTLCVEYASQQRLPEYFAGEKAEDIAAAFQKVLEEVQMASFEKNLSKDQQHPLPVVLSGGTFANVRLNQCFLDHSQVKSIFVMPPMSDEGQPLGAAICSLQRHAPEDWRPHRLENVYWGPDFTEQEIEQTIQRNQLSYRRSDCVEVETARLLNEGKVVARFHGRMEFGPRALGNRSILARPTDPSVNDWLNKRLKRTEFMPFAPSVLDYAVERLFCGNYRKGLFAAEFMTTTFDCSEWMKNHCPAVVHVDGTARPQIVTSCSNPSFYQVLVEYEKLSGLPLVVNTSFNMHEEPIVCTPEDAVRAFLQGHLDVLTIGPFIIQQKMD